MRNYLLILFFLPSLCFSETSLWQVSKNGNTLFLGGTIHVLKKEDYPLPVEFDMAFKKSDKLVFETDIDKAKMPEFAKKMAQMFSYPPGKSLKKTLNPETVNEIAESMLDIGQKTPIQVRQGKDRYVLVEGLHRLHACMELGDDTIEAYVVQAKKF